MVARDQISAWTGAYAVMNELRRTARLPRFSDRCSLRGLDIEVSHYLITVVETPDVVERAFEKGINFFLLGADLHWPMYEATRIGLRRILQASGVRQKIVVAGMSFVNVTNGARAAFREIVKAVPELEALDVLVIGSAGCHDFISRLQEYETYIEKGWIKARSIGALFENYRTARIAMAAGAVGVAMIPFGAGRRDVVSSLNCETSLMGQPPLYAFAASQSYYTDAELAEVGLPKDKWRPSQSDYYRYALSWAAFNGAVLERTSRDDLDELEAAIDKGPLNEEELSYIDDLDDLVNGRAQLADDDLDA